MLRILHVVGGLSRGGTETTIMNIYRHIDRGKIQFDFVSHHPRMMDYEEEVKSLGGNIYYIPEFKGHNYVNYKKAWRDFFRKHPNYSILHSHAWSTAAIYLPIARENSIYTIVHSHSVSAGTGASALGRILLKPKLRMLADYYMACTKEAGEWLFGDRVVCSDRFTVVPNAIDITCYRYNENERKRIRAKENIEDKLVIGHVGSFNSNKNQSFIIDVFRRVHKLNHQSVLWLIGDGENKKRIENTCGDISDSITFWGIRDDVPLLLQAMDVFVFPSRHESFGNAALEAEVAGVPTICSINVPREAAVPNHVQYLPLNDVDSWVEGIIVASKKEHKDTYNTLKGTRFDITVTAEWLQNFYLMKGLER